MKNTHGAIGALDNMNALFIGVVADFTELGLLIDDKTNIDEIVDPESKGTLLTIAADSQLDSAVCKLIHHGADPYKKNGSGKCGEV